MDKLKLKPIKPVAENQSQSKSQTQSQDLLDYDEEDSNMGSERE